MNTRHPLAAIQRVAPFRKPGYLEECLRVGKVIGAEIEFTPEVYHDLHRRFTLGSAKLPLSGSAEPRPTKKGLGDLVGKIAMPMARALKLSCIDPVTNDLKPESPCARRKQKLNELGFKLIPPKK